MAPKAASEKKAAAPKTKAAASKHASFKGMLTASRRMRNSDSVF